MLPSTDKTREKNYRLSTGKILADYPHGPTLSIFFFRKKSILYFFCLQEVTKDTTDFVNFIEKTKMKTRTFLVSMDATSLFTNIPQKKGIEIGLQSV